MDHLSPPPPHSATLPVLAISLLGILTTAIFLLAYYLFVANCPGLRWRRRNLTLSTTPSLRHYHTPPPTPPTGLDPATIRTLPIIRFSGGGANECAVCLNEFHVEESLRLLPSCSHAFHIDCIDVWLQSNANCPLCRADITAAVAFPFLSSGSVVIDVRCDDGDDRRAGKVKRVVSKGDEWIDAGRERVQPVRRSFSMDSCLDRALYVEIQEMLRRRGDDGGGGEGSGRVRRSLFSFGHGRSSVLPIQIEPKE